MNLRMLAGIAFFAIGLALAVLGIVDVGVDSARPLIETENNTSVSMMAQLRSIAVPVLAGLALAMGGLLIGLSVGNWRHPRTQLKPGDEVVNPEGYHKMKHV